MPEDPRATPDPEFAAPHASESPETADEPDDGKPEFSYVHSQGFAEAMRAMNATLWISTYQAGKLAVFRSHGGRISMLPRTFDKAMGLAVDPQRIALATRYQIWQLRNEPILAPRIKPHDTHDACFVPRTSHVTGNIDAHEIAWSADGELWIVNTQFCCLCTLDPQYSFVPRWRPPFVSELKREDRCHVNGLAMENGRPKYVTAFSETDAKEAWREHKRDGGCLIDVDSGEVVTRGMSMPHSPRLFDGKLWVLDSGNGQLCLVDKSNGKRETVAELPGYTRGLAFSGRWAFVGLSKIRETAVFGGVTIAEKLDERKCGVWVVDVPSGQPVGFVDFQKTVSEIFDVQVLPGIRFPAIIGFEKATIQRACVIGPEVPLGSAGSGGP